ncbi:MAG: DUF2298 domain-containing protein [Candidatus Levybacteria bacterium]|nr:DUF2298 domain-containing protein [Candidatus Levybacteria bacterium]
MTILDFLTIMQWWSILFLLGVIFIPITQTIFSSFFDKGYVFSKVIGYSVLSYVMFLLSILHFIHFTFISLLFILFNLIIFNFLVAKKTRTWTSISKLIPLFIAEELIFILCLISWSFIRGTQPEIIGLEKFMDFGFVNSILRSEYFPPKDMWLTPYSINYYYFGHLITAVLTKISLINPSITYNLMIATLFSLCFTLSFSLGTTLCYHAFLIKKGVIIKAKTLFSSGIITAFLLTLSGNLHTIYSLFLPYTHGYPIPIGELIFSINNFPNRYWYPDATRFIYNTIHEFPIYSFVVSDLHGHVIDIPIVITIIAILLNVFLIKSVNNYKLIILGFFIAIAFMSNVWDSLIYFLLISIFIFLIDIDKNYLNINNLFKSGKNIFIVFITFLLFSFPFSYYFEPSSLAHGIGILCAPKFLTDISRIGPFLFEINHCQKSPFYQLATLYGFFYFWVLCFLGFLFIKRSIRKTDIFVLIIIGLSTILIIVPEFIYIKDIYPNHYRANTMFKLVYQSFIMLSISSSYIMIRILHSVKNNIDYFYKKVILFLCIILGSCLILIVSAYPFFAIPSFYGKLDYKGLDGIKYLKKSYPDDYESILWINKNIKGQPVILEAQGDSYTEYARISSNTGLPTLLGWTVHEWLWRGSYDIPSPRIVEIKNLYESNDISIVKKLIKKYSIAYVFIGSLEKRKYINLNEKIFNKLGFIIFNKKGSKIYKIY